MTLWDVYGRVFADALPPVGPPVVTGAGGGAEGNEGSDEA